MALTVSDRDELVLAALTDRADEARFEIAGEVVALQRSQDESEVQVDTKAGDNERDEDGTEAVDGIVRRANDGLFAPPLCVGPRKAGSHGTR
jgi:hypothetical protein